MRRWGHRKGGVGLFFKVVNRNKRTITLDLHQERGQELARELASQSDVVAENFRTGTVEKWGLGYGDLAKLNPGLIMLHLTGFGRTGPRAYRPGFGSLVEAFSGAVYVNGHADREPLIQPFGLGDTSAAIFAAFAAMVALYGRDHGAGGQEIDLGLYEGLFAMLGAQIVNYDQLGVVQERIGADNPFVAPRGTFRTRDGAWVAVAGSTQATFERICLALDIPQVSADPRFSTNALRIENGDALNQAIRTAIGQLVVADVLHRADKHDATIGPVHNVADVFRDEQFGARNNIATVPDDELGPVRMQNVAPRLSRTPGRIAHAGPRKGEYNQDVYGSLLGLSAADIEALAADGVV
jgi:formyl-CoA transferase